jgi:hypothetical protein
MKITIERPSYKNTITIESEGDDLTLDKLIDEMINPALHAMGFAEKSIEELFGK